MSGEGSAGGGQPVVDWETARRLTGGDAELLVELGELFGPESAKHLAAIRDAIAAADGPGLTRAAHTLKSSAKLFGAEVLVDRALEMETLGQDSRFSDADARLPELESAARDVVEALADLSSGGA
jgi:HPt (histidine-containing phosphotransfer) domain-containing protein